MNEENLPVISDRPRQDLTIQAQSVKKQDLIKYWDREYINSRLDKIPDHKAKMLFTFLWRSGVRISEAVGLRKENIDFDNHTITIRWMKSRRYNKRVVPIHPHLLEILQLYTASLRSNQRVFPISRVRAWQLSRQYFNGSPHQFRHSFAVNWLRCGGELVTLSRILGHSKIQTTMEYLKIVPIDQGKELLKIDFS
jgi:integrase